jgi:hypothetical protein
MFLQRIPTSRCYADIIMYRNSTSFESAALITEGISITGLVCVAQHENLLFSGSFALAHQMLHSYAP